MPRPARSMARARSWDGGQMAHRLPAVALGLGKHEGGLEQTDEHHALFPALAPNRSAGIVALDKFEPSVARIKSALMPKTACRSRRSARLALEVVRGRI